MVISEPRHFWPLSRHLRWELYLQLVACGWASNEGVMSQSISLKCGFIIFPLHTFTGFYTVQPGPRLQIYVSKCSLPAGSDSKTSPRRCSLSLSLSLSDPSAFTRLIDTWKSSQSEALMFHDSVEAFPPAGGDRRELPALHVHGERAGVTSQTDSMPENFSGNVGISDTKHQQPKTSTRSDGSWVSRISTSTSEGMVLSRKKAVSGRRACPKRRSSSTSSFMSEGRMERGVNRRMRSSHPCWEEPDAVAWAPSQDASQMPRRPSKLWGPAKVFPENFPWWFWYANTHNQTLWPAVVGSLDTLSHYIHCMVNTSMKLANDPPDYAVTSC